MRALIHVTFPNEPFNSAVRKGTAGDSMKRILDELKPEAVYFTEYNGQRVGILIVGYSRSVKSPLDCRALLPVLQCPSGIPRRHEPRGSRAGRPRRAR